MTFVTHSSLTMCAHVLDNARLGKQRVEAYQILRTLRGHSHGWKNHPAVKMWRGYESALGLYMNAMIDEWVARGFRNTMQKEEFIQGTPPPKFPWWFTWEPLQMSHRASLIRKMPSWYLSKFEDSVSHEYIVHGYIWPHKLTSGLRVNTLCEICECLNFSRDE